MRTKTIAVLLATLVASSLAEAQRPAAPPVPVIAQPAPVFQPVWPKMSRAPSLADLVLAKIDMHEDGPRVILMIESYRTEKAVVKVTKMVREKRERTILVDGEEQVQNYVVNIPVTEEREVNRSVPAGRKPKTVDAAEFRFYDLNAKQLTIDDVAKKLESLRPIFLIDRNGQPPQALSELGQRAIKEDCVIATTKEKVRQYDNRLPYIAPAFPGQPVVPGQVIGPVIAPQVPQLARPQPPVVKPVPAPPEATE